MSVDEAARNFAQSGRAAEPLRLEDVVITAELATRTSRPPDHAAECRAMAELAEVMAESPQRVLQKLADMALSLTGAGSAGISILDATTNDGGAAFRWAATAGAFAAFSGGTLPRDFSPCGVVLDRGATQLMTDPVRFYPYIEDLRPHVSEVLLVPFFRGDTPVGTVWVVAHDHAKRFDAEDARRVTSLSKFASAAIQALTNAEMFRGSEARFRELADAMPQIVWAARPDGTLDYYNARWFEYIGVPPEQAGEATVWDRYVHPDDLARVAAAWTQSLGSGRRYSVEFRVRGRDERYRWFLVRAEPVCDVSGHVARWFGTCTDIEDRKWTEARNQFLIALDDAVRPLADAADITAAHARLLGEHLSADRCAYADVEDDEDTFNLTGDYNRGVPSIVGRYTFTDFGEEVLRLMRANQPYVVEDVDTHQPSVGDLSYYRQTMIQSVVCVPLHKAGRFVAAMAVHQRVPRRWSSEEVCLVQQIAARCWESIERARVERTLRQSEERLAFSVEAAELGTFYCPMPMGAIVWNDKCKEHFWLPADAVVDFERFYAIIHPDDRERTRHAVEQAVFDRQPYDIQYRTVSGDGQTRWVRAKGRAYYGVDGNPSRFDGVTLDVTEQKRAEWERERLYESERAARAEAETANRAKDKFLAVLSHELRTPLTPVAMAATAMEMDPRLPFEFRDDVSMIRRNIDLETRLIDDLLDLSRVTSGKLQLNLQPTDVHRLLQHVLETVGAELHEKQLVVERDFAATSYWVDADAARLQQSCWNLIKNAAKFSPSGGRVFVRTRNDAGHLIIEVADRGVGIAPEVLPRIFDPFEQGEADVTRRYGGLGLGLAIAKAVVDMHAGAISAASDGIGKGAVLTLSLPLTQADSRATSTRSDRPTDVHVRAVRLLLVEDHPDTAKVLLKLLRTDGSDVRWASSIAAALELAAAEAFDVVVSDLGLPDGSGHDLMRQLRQRYPNMLGIAMSGYGMEEDILHSRDAGFVEHLVKPVSVPQLREAIRRVATSRSDLFNKSEPV